MSGAPNPYLQILSTGTSVIGAGAKARGNKRALDAQQDALDAETARQKELQAKADKILADMLGQAGWGNTQQAVQTEQNQLINAGQTQAGNVGAGTAAAAASVGPGVVKAGRVRASSAASSRLGRSSAMLSRIKAELVRRQLLNELMQTQDVERQGLAAAADRSMRAYGYERDAAGMQGIGDRTLGELLQGLGGAGNSLGSIGV